MRFAARATLLGLSLLVVPLAAEAGEPRTHDNGFFLRLAIGGGHGSTKIDDARDELEFRGPSGTFDVAVGATVGHNLAVHATLGGFALVEPTAEFNGFEETADDISMAMTMFGGGVTYFVGESNLYLTASAGAATLSFDFDGDREDSDTGWAVEGGIGKEWWVSDRWGLGVQGSVGYHDIPPGDADENFKGASFALKFTATLN